MHGVVFWKKLYRIGVSSIVVGIRRSWVENLCKYSGREDTGSKHCLHAVTYLYQLCHVRRELNTELILKFS
jgi:hypothetical protein